MTQVERVSEWGTEKALPELWRDLVGDISPGEEASGLGHELRTCWQALVSIETALSQLDPGAWTQAVQDTLTALNVVRQSYGELAVDPADSGFAGRFQEHFELETLGLEEPGGEFLFCDPYTMLVFGACVLLEKRVGKLGRAIAGALALADRELLLHEVSSHGYALRRAMERVTIGVLEQLPLDTSSRSLVPGFRCGLKDLLDWREVLQQLELQPSDQAIQHALETLWSSPASGALQAMERQEVVKYQDLTSPDLNDLLAQIEARPLVERAISN